MSTIIKAGLIRGRHELPVDDYIFDTIDDITDVNVLTNTAANKLLQMFPHAVITTACLPNQADYTDIPVFCRGQLGLYVTGLTVALVAVLNAARQLGVRVILYHYDNSTLDYFTQDVL